MGSDVGNYIAMVDNTHSVVFTGRIWFRTKDTLRIMTEKKGTIPGEKTERWKKNEKLIVSDPALKRVRDIQQGFRPTSTITTGADVSQQYKDNYDKIDFTKREEADKPKFRTKINGKYTDED